MRQIRARLLSLMLTCAMLLSLLPVTTLAAGECTCTQLGVVNIDDTSRAITVYGEKETIPLSAVYTSRDGCTAEHAITYTLAVEVNGASVANVAQYASVDQAGGKLLFYRHPNATYTVSVTARAEVSGMAAPNNVAVSPPVAYTVDTFVGVADWDNYVMDIGEGSITVTEGSNGAYTYTQGDEVLTAPAGQAVTISGTSTAPDAETQANRIVIRKGSPEIVLKDLTITLNRAVSGIALTAWGTRTSAVTVAPTIRLEGENNLTGGYWSPAVQINYGATLTIEGEGSLYAEGHGNMPGIGAGNNTESAAWTSATQRSTGRANTGGGNLVINGGHITSVGSGRGTSGLASGMGQSYYETPNSITINGGVVDVRNNSSGCGIVSANLTINGGEVSVRSAPNYGLYASADLTINGGTLTSVSGSTPVASAGNLTINGGNARGYYAGEIAGRRRVQICLQDTDGSDLSAGELVTVTEGDKTWTARAVDGKIYTYLAEDATQLTVTYGASGSQETKQLTFRAIDEVILVIGQDACTCTADSVGGLNWSQRIADQTLQNVASLSVSFTAASATPAQDCTAPAHPNRPVGGEITYTLAVSNVTGAEVENPAALASLRGRTITLQALPADGATYQVTVTAATAGSEPISQSFTVTTRIQNRWSMGGGEITVKDGTDGSTVYTQGSSTYTDESGTGLVLNGNSGADRYYVALTSGTASFQVSASQPTRFCAGGGTAEIAIASLTGNGAVLFSHRNEYKVSAYHSFFYPDYAVLSLDYADITFQADGSITQGAITVTGYQWNDRCYLIGAGESGRSNANVTNATDKDLTLTVNGRSVTIPAGETVQVASKTPLATEYVGSNDGGISPRQVIAYVLPGSPRLLVLAGVKGSATNSETYTLNGIDTVSEVYIDPRINTLKNQLLNGNTAVKRISVNAATVDGAFFGMSEEIGREITLGANVKTLVQPWLLRHASALTVDPGNTAYKMADDVLFSANGKTLYAAPTSKTGEYTVPAGVTVIGESAFADSKLTSITIGPDVSEIGDFAFLGCESLEAVHVDAANPYFTSEDGVLYDQNKTALIYYPIGKTQEAFAVPDGVVSVQGGAVNGNPYLTTLTLPNNAITIGAGGFSELSGLKKVVFQHAAVSGDGAFAGDTNIEELYLPAGYSSWTRALFSGAQMGDKAVSAASMDWIRTTQNAIVPSLVRRPYTGEAITGIVTTGSIDVTIEYLGEDGQYSAAAPVCKEVGEYTVGYRAVYSADEAPTQRVVYGTHIFTITGLIAQPDWFFFTPVRNETDSEIGLGADVQLDLGDSEMYKLPEGAYVVYYSKDGTGAKTVAAPREPGKYLVSVEIIEDHGYRADTLELGWYVVLEEGSNDKVLSFLAFGGTSIEPVILPAGTAVPTVEDPVRNGFTFGGWFEDTTLQIPVVIPATMPNESAVYYAKWNPIRYTLTYDMGEAAEAGVANPNAGTTELLANSLRDIVLENPTWDNHTFLGWTWSWTDGTTTVEQTEPQTVVVLEQGSYGNYAFTANWQQNTYEVTFVANNSGYTDASISGKESVSYIMPREYEMALESVPTPVRTGYDFVGWAAQEDGAGDVLTEAIVFDSDQTYYAKWEPKTITMTYLAGGGSFTIEGDTATKTTTTGKYGELLTTPVPTRAGYDFAGWDWPSELTTYPAENMTVSARWSAKTYTLTFRVTDPATGQAEGDVALTGAYDAAITGDHLSGGAIPTPDYRNAGYLFLGWQDESGSIITELSTQYIRGDAVYTAYFTADAGWTVTFHAQPYGQTDTGAVFAGNVAEKSYSVTAASPFQVEDVPLPTRDEYVFKGWADANGTPISGELTYGGLGGDQDYYAVYEAAYYTVIFNYNGGTAGGGTDASVSYSVASGQKVAANQVPALTLEGKRFLGWLNLNDGRTYGDAEAVAALAVTGPVSYVALWETLTYTVTYQNYNEGSGTLVVPTVYEQAPAAPAVTPAGGYVFDYWEVVEPAGGVTINGTPKTQLTPDDLTKLQVTQDITLSAHFYATTYQVTFDYNGGTQGTDTSKVFQVDYGKSLGDVDSFTVPAPERSGSNLLGWMKSGDSTVYTADTVESVTITDTTVFIAVWSGDVRVTFHANGGAITTGNDFLTGQSGSVISGDSLPTVARTGYSFDGWYTDSTCQTPAASGDTYVFPTQDAIWYAKWTPVPVIITFEYGDGTAGGEGSSTISRPYGGKVVENVGALPAPTRTGYELKGWTNDAGLMVPVDKMPDQIVTDPNGMTYRAYYEQVMVTVTFRAGDGAAFPDSTTVKSFTGAQGSTMPFADVPVPAKANYTFVGWKPAGAEDSEAQSTGSMEFTAAATYVAVWEQSSYTVTFNLNGGSVGGDTGPVTGTYSHGAAYPAAPVPTKDGNSLLGWMESTSGTIYGAGAGQTAFPSAVTEDAIYIAVWSANSYTLTFNKYDYGVDGAGDGSTRTVAVINGGIVAAPTATAPAGKVFVHWLVTEPSAGIGGKTTYTTDELLNLNVTQNMTFEAVFQAADVTVTYLANGGRFGDGEAAATASGQAGAEIGASAPQDPVRTGYTFDGWYMDSSLAAAAGTVFPDASATWYAKWTAKDVVVTFLYGEGAVGSDKSNTATVKFDETLQGVNIPAPKRDGYTLTGWTRQDSGVIIPSANMAGQVVDREDGVTYTAYYEQNIKTITFDPNGGAFPDGTQGAKSYQRSEGGAMSFADVPVPTLAAKTFVGWSTVQNGTAVAEDSMTFDADKTYYAVWEQSSYTVTFNLNGGSVGSDPGPVSGTYSHGTAYPAAPAATKDGNSLLGWMESTSGTIYGAGAGQTAFPSAVTEDAIYIAVWSANSYTLTFNKYDYGVDGAGDGSTRTVAVINGGIVAAPTATAPAGKVFVHWLVTEPSAGIGGKTTYTTDELLNLNVTQNMTFEAVFQAADVTVTYLANGGRFGDGEAAATASGQAGAEIGASAPQDPVRTGYTFDGWYMDSSLAAAAGTVFPDASATWYAKWTAKDVVVTFLYGEGAVGSDKSNTATVKFDETLQGVNIPAPKRDGYTLTGWTRQDSGVIIPSANMAGQVVDREDGVTYTAYYEQNIKTITFDPNGGAFPDGTQGAKSYQRSEGGAMSFADVPVPTLAAKTFVGWSTVQNGTAVAEDSMTFDADKTYYAVWTDATYTVKFLLNGGNVSGNTTDVERTGLAHGSSFGSAPDVTLSGNSLTGWLNMADGKMYGSGLEAFPSTVTEDATYIAIWGADSYAVIFAKYDYSGSDGDSKTLKVDTIYLGVPAAPVVTPPTGKQFTGWQITSGALQDAGGNTLNSSSGVITADALTTCKVVAAVTLEAQYSDPTYTVTFNAGDGGSLSGNSTYQVTNGSTMAGMNFTVPTASKAGATSNAWINGLTGEAMTADQIKNLTINSDITFTAMWVGDVTVTFVVNGGSTSDSTVFSAASGTKITPPAVTRTGYTFKEWNSKEDGSGTAIVLDGGSYTLGITTTWYAQWEKQGLTVTVNDSGITYTGTAQTPALTVTVDSTPLTAGQYVAVYSSNVNAGTDTAAVTVYGLGDYAGLTGTAVFSIGKAGQTVTFAKGTSGLTAAYGETFLNTAAAVLDGAGITYSSSNTNVATVNGTTGEVTILKAGSVDITATAAATGNVEGGSAQYTLTISRAVPALSFSNSAVSAAPNGVVSNALTTTPENLSITYSSSNSGVAAVDRASGAITLTDQVGTAVITATSTETEQYESATATYTIVVSSSAIRYTAAGYTGVYDGSAHGITVTTATDGAQVKYGTSAGSYDQAASPTYTDVGTYTVCYQITAPGYDTVTGTAEVAVSAAELTEASVAGGTYTGSQVQGTVSGVKAGALTVAERDYTVAYHSNTDAGTAVAVITGTGNYTGALVRTFTIAPKTLTEDMVAVIGDQAYTGGPITPAVTVTDGTALVEGRDYHVTYSENTAVGAAKVTVTGAGNYTGEVSKTFTITNTGAFEIKVDNTALIYDGGEKRPAIVVYANGKVLTEGTDYTAAYTDNTDAGTGTITVTGTGNYAGWTAGTAKFTIAKADKAASFAEGSVSKSYGDAGFTNALTLTPDDSAAVTYATSDPGVATVDENGEVTIVGAGTAIITATAAATGNYSAASADYTLTVSARRVTFTVDAIPDQVYTGSEIKPVVTVKDGDRVLTEHVDYTVSYSDNTAVGTAGVTVTGKGSYAGSTGSAGFEIVAGATGLEVAAIDPVTYTGQAHTPEPWVKYAGVALTRDTDYTLAYAANLNAGTATVTIAGKDGTAYEGLRSIVNFTIQPKDMGDLTVDAVADQTYTGGEIKPGVRVSYNSLTLTEGTDYTLSYSGNTDVGTASITITGHGNYTGRTTAQFQIVAKTTAPVISDIPDQNYTGEAIEPAVVIRDGDRTLTQGEDYTVAYSDNIYVGTAAVTVTYIGNYAGVSQGTKTFRIVSRKILLDVTVSPGQDMYEGDEITVTVKVGDTQLEETTDYTLSYGVYNENGDLVTVDGVENAGVYVITAAGAGKFEGASGSAVFVRKPRSVDGGLTLEGVTDSSLTYDGQDHSALLDSLVVKLVDASVDPAGETVLEEDTDYTVSMSYNNGGNGAVGEMKDAGLYVVTVQGIGNYQGNTAVLAIAITPKDIKDVEVTVGEAVYNAQEQIPGITVTDGGSDMSEGTDYTVTAEDSYIAANEDGYEITITGAGNYTGIRTERFIIRRAGIVVTCEEQTAVYGSLPKAEEISFTVTGKVEGDDVQVVMSDPEVTGAGEYTYTASLTGGSAENYTVNADGAKLTVTAKDMSGEQSGVTAQLSPTEGYYTGAAVTPTVTVKDGAVALTEGVDYTVTYLNKDGQTVTTMVERDTYTVRVTGANGYTGSIDLTFTISSAPSSGGGGGGSVTKYILNFDVNGGTSVNAVSKTSGAKITLDQTTRREGYLFTGWYLDAELTEKVESVTLTKDMTVYAGWQPDISDPDDAGVSKWLNTTDHIKYLNGYPGGAFGPNDNMTRAEAAQMFYSLLLNKNSSVTVSFSDVDGQAWYAAAVHTLASLGIMEGVGDGRFAPERAITRAEFTAIAARFAALDTSGGNTFSDVAEGAWYYGYVTGCAKYGWITGYPDGTFRPNATITRAEVTVIVNRMLGRSADQSYIDGREDGLIRFSDVAKSHWAYYDIMEATNAHDHSKTGGVESWIDQE